VPATASALMTASSASFASQVASAAPVPDGASLATAFRLAPPIMSNRPPAKTASAVTARALTGPFGAGDHVASGAPVVSDTLAMEG